jgi:hypothetical protein
MRTFMFPEFIETVIGGDFVEILDSESRSRWSRIVDTGEPPQNYQLFGSEYQSGASRSIPPDRIIYLTPIQTVDLLPIGAVTSVRATLARQVAALTSSELKLRGVYSLLDTFIPLSDRGTEQGGRYARQIVEEFVTNSVLHSNPSLGYIYGRFDYGMPQQRAANKGFFGLSVWDNGTSASKVLTDSMGMPLNPLNVMNSAAEYANETFRVKYREPGVEDPVLENINIQGSSDVVDLLSRKQAYRALGMFLPGVTSEPGRESVRNPEDTPKIPNGRVPDTMSGLSGTGLDRVVQIAIDTLGGRIDYAGGQIRLRIAQSFDPGGFPRSNTYDVELTYGRDSVWPIEGNLLTFRLPGMWPS